MGKTGTQCGRGKMHTCKSIGIYPEKRHGKNAPGESYPCAQGKVRRDFSQLCMLAQTETQETSFKKKKKILHGRVAKWAVHEDIQTPTGDRPEPPTLSDPAPNSRGDLTVSRSLFQSPLFSDF